MSIDIPPNPAEYDCPHEVEPVAVLPPAGTCKHCRHTVHRCTGCYNWANRITRYRLPAEGIQYLCVRCIMERKIIQDRLAGRDEGDVIPPLRYDLGEI